MGACERSRELRDAAGGCSADPRASRSLVVAFASDARGATAIEYAIVAGGIAVAVVSAVAMLGANVLALFNSVKF
ncbi:MAG: Flp family type IVb pilin [Deltaproteobacteria bacterium]|nr:Flp family type IVb pilin [Deltaproteobacteria bacterium]